jgi:hypothetical protein
LKMETPHAEVPLQGTLMKMETPHAEVPLQGTLMEVIGAGWSRTGTTSFKQAMEILYSDKCYHMAEVVKNGDAVFWAEFGPDSNLDDVYCRENNRYAASCAFPSAGFYAQQLAKYPHAKVVLTTRDPAEWYRSCCETIFCMIPGSPFCSVFVQWAQLHGMPMIGAWAMMKRIVAVDCFHNDWSEENVIHSFEDYNSKVELQVSKGKFLAHRPEDGWAPLCDFLGKPVPDVPYPHSNDTAEFQQHKKKAMVAGAVIATIELIMLAAFVYACVLIFRDIYRE